MALCSTVCLPWSVLDFDIVKTHLVACLVALVTCIVGYAWVSKLCNNSLNRHLGAFSMSILLTKTSSDECNLSSTLSHERLTCILLMLGGAGGALPEPCKMTSSRPQMCMCLLKRSETDSTRVVGGPDVHSWGLCLQPNIVQDVFHLPENTKIGKFATGALCSSQMKEGSH